VTYCYLVSDLHGYIDKYNKLFASIKSERPQIVFLGGDLLPSGAAQFSSSSFENKDFITDFLISKLLNLKNELNEDYPIIYLILGNDDARVEESAIMNASKLNVWDYINNDQRIYKNYMVFGYSFVPPTPFLLKDWEKFDVSRYVDHGCVSPEKGMRTIHVPTREIRYSSIEKDLNDLTKGRALSKSIFLFHSPPYKTKLDRAALDGKIIDHAPMDVHVGSIAIKNFIIEKKPLITLHGHVHESARITGSWKDKIDETYCFSAAHDGPELALVKFNLEEPEYADRELI